MRAEAETMPSDDAASFFVRRFDGRGFAFRWHVHAEHELTWVEAGRGTRFVGDSIERFEAGEVVLLAGGLPHTWHGGAECRSVVVHFRGDCFGPGFLDRPEMRNVAALMRRAGAGLRFTGRVRVEATRTLAELDAARGPRRVALLIDLLGRLAATRSLHRLCDAPQTDPLHRRDQDRLGRVLDFINARAEDAIALSDAAAVAHLTPPAFARFFRRTTGQTFVQYLHRLRVHHAARLLTDTDAPVTEVAFRCGFGNLSNFNRVFRRRLGTTPTGYRASVRPARARSDRHDRIAGPRRA